MALTLVLMGMLLPSPTGVAAEDSNETTTTTAPTQNPLPTNPDTTLEQLLDDQASLLGERWGGGWANADGTVTAALTGDNPAPSPLASNPKVQIVTVRFSFAHLSAVIKTVTEKLNPLLAAELKEGSLVKWPYDGRVDLRANIVEVKLDEDYEDRRKDVEAELASELNTGVVRIISGTVEAYSNNCGTRLACTAPFRGGIRVVGMNPPNHACTLGFVMKDSLGRRYQSTASHCAGSPWNHNGRAIGPTTWTEDLGDHDFKVIKQNNQAEPAPTNWVYRDANNATGVTMKITNPSAGLGFAVCLLGQNGGESCATVEEVNSITDGRGGFGRTSAMLSICHGDSGGPVINQSNNKAYGIHRGTTPPIPEPFVCGASFKSVFTWMPAATAASGYEVLLTPTSQTLASGQQMPAGYALVAPNGAYDLQMQGDGNLVMYNCCGTALWHTNTWGNPGALAVMQNDGNLVVYSAVGTPLWNRPTGGWVAGSYLELQNDANLVIYGPTRTVSWHRFCNC